MSLEKWNDARIHFNTIILNISMFKQTYNQYLFSSRSKYM